MDRRTTRSLGAILAIDIVGYSRQMGRDENATLRRLQAYRDITAEIVARHGGRVFGVAGDSQMAVMSGALEALECALSIQDAIAERNAGLPEERRMPLRIGINFGKVLIEGEGVYGDDVNIAARAEALAGKGGICVTGAVFDRVKGKLPLGYEDYGPQRFKNIDRRIRTLRVRREPLMVGRVVPGRPPIPRSRWRAVAAVALLAVAGASAWSFYLNDQVAAWRGTAAEQAAATGAARERAQALLASLEAAESRISAERQRAAELLADLLAAEKQAAERVRSAESATRAEADRAAAEEERGRALLASLQDAETRAAGERERAEGLLGALRETEVQAAAARDETARRRLGERGSARKRAAALLASWEATERQAAAEHTRVEALLAALQEAEAQAAAQSRRSAARAAAQAETDRAAVAERTRVAELVATLESAERKSGEELRKGQDLMAAIEGGDGAPERERVQALLAALEAAGRTAAVERTRAELLLSSWAAPGGAAAPAQAEAQAARQAAEDRAGERERAEALLETWRSAALKAAQERARAQALLVVFTEAETQARAQAERRAAELARMKALLGAAKDLSAPSLEERSGSREEAQEADPAAAEDASAPPPEPEESAAAARQQPAALPDQPEAGDAALSGQDATTDAPAPGPSLAAVERMLGERAEEFRRKLFAYNSEYEIEPTAADSLARFRIRSTQVLGAENGLYKVRTNFEPSSRTMLATGTGAVDPILFLKFDGGDFEIVGHDYPDSVGRKRAGQQMAQPDQPEAGDAAPSETAVEAPAPGPSLAAVERMLGERADEFRDKLYAYNAEYEIEPTAWDSIAGLRLRSTQVLGAENGLYKVRAIFEPVGGFVDYTVTGAIDPILYLKFDGDDFEIVGHDYPDSVGRKRAGQEATVSLDAVERLLGERAAAATTEQPETGLRGN